MNGYSGCLSGWGRQRAAHGSSLAWITQRSLTRAMHAGGRAPTLIGTRLFGCSSPVDSRSALC